MLRCDGQRGCAPVLIWDAITGLQVKALRTYHVEGVAALAFSRNEVGAQQLVTVGEEENHCVAIWRSTTGRWHDGDIQCVALGDRLPTLFVMFLGLGAKFTVMSAGINHVRFWNIQGKKLICLQGLFGTRGKVQPALCGTVVKGKPLTGMVSGHVYCWEGRLCVDAVKAHDGPVNAMFASSDGSVFVTGAKDGVVKLWTADFSLIKSFDMNRAQPTPSVAAIRSVCVNRPKSTLLVGTQGSEIYELSRETGSVTLVSEGHCKGETWGLHAHPTNGCVFATSGDDQTVRIWDCRERRLTAKLDMDTMSRSVAWSPDGRLLAAGLGAGKQKKDGAFLVVNVSDMSIAHEARPAKKSITHVAWSPDGTGIALASRDNNIYIHDVHNGFMLKARCGKHSNPVLRFDYAQDGQFLRSCCEGQELLFYNSSTGDHLPTVASLKDVHWATTNTQMCWPVQGVWPAEADFEMVHAVARSSGEDGALLAAVGTDARVEVYNFPCVARSPENGKISLIGHSDAVTNAAFTADNSFLLTLGGEDRCVMQWRVTPVARPAAPSHA